jgi:DNA gyrase subunit A
LETGEIESVEYSHGKILQVNLEDEMKKSYIDYAMSVIVGRALPDVRDGLKPVHRRILYSMYDTGMTADKPFKKSAWVVGGVLAKYHPHGDTAVYDTMVRMAQDFSYRYQLVDGHGNFGSVDGDRAAAMRYTEAKMSKVSMELLRDIDKETVDFVPNYDESLKEPSVLPSRFPNLLVNGSTGIAVGMATNIPPHNMTEVLDALDALVENPDITIKELMDYVKGPDFPTAGIIMGLEGIHNAYHTGRGSVKVRSKNTIEHMKSGKERIIVHELPYQVNKARLIMKIADLVRDKKIEGITDLRDESDRNGMRVVIEMKKGVIGDVILNQLYKHTQMQTTFSIIMLALVENKPHVLNLKQILKHYLAHQKSVFTRRTQFELRKAEARSHIVEGLLLALDNIERVIKIIRGSENTEAAKMALMLEIGLSDIQAKAILDMKLSRLTALEQTKLDEEYIDLKKTIGTLEEILVDEKKLMQLITDEFARVRDKYGDDRKTAIIADEGDLEIEDLIAEEDAVITITHRGYIKRLPATTYRSQKRGGKGVKALSKKDEDFVEHLFITTTHHFLMFFTNTGRVMRLKVHILPEASRTAKGSAIVNLLHLEKGEYVTTVIPVKEYDEDKYLLTVTRKGVVKKSSLSAYDTNRKDGIIALTLDDDDELISVNMTDGSKEVIMGTKHGYSIRFSEEDVRKMGRTARGVKGITLGSGDEVIGADVVNESADLLVVSKNGYGKRSDLSEYRTQTRGGKGIFTIKGSDRNGDLVALMIISEGDDIMLISKEGLIIREPISDISKIGRVTQGVRVMNMGDNDQVVAVARVAIKEEEV